MFDTGITGGHHLFIKSLKADQSMSRDPNTDPPRPGQQPDLPPTRPDDPAQPEQPPPLPPDAPQPPAPVREPSTPKPAGDPPTAEPTRLAGGISQPLLL